MDYTALRILQARILEWVAVPVSRGSSQPRDWTQVSRIVGGFFTSWATRTPTREAIREALNLSKQQQHVWHCPTCATCIMSFFLKTTLWDRYYNDSYFLDEGVGAGRSVRLSRLMWLPGQEQVFESRQAVLIGHTWIHHRHCLLSALLYFVLIWLSSPLFFHLSPCGVDPSLHGMKVGNQCKDS